MKLLFFLISLIYCLPWFPSAVPLKKLFANVVHGQEDVIMHQVPNFKAVNHFGMPTSEFRFWLPENLYRTIIRKQAMPGDPTLAITGFPNGRTVEFHPAYHPTPGKYLFISNPIELKNYKRVSENRFAKDGQIVSAKIKLEGYLKGKNIIITEKAYLYEDGGERLFSRLLHDELRDSQILDLELVKRYPYSIPRMSLFRGTTSVWFSPIVPPAQFWHEPMLFDVVPLNEFTTIHSTSELGDGLHELEAELLLKFGNDQKRVKFSFVVAMEADHVTIKRVLKISYPSESSARFNGDRRSGSSSATVLEQAKDFLNREVFDHIQPVERNGPVAEVMGVPTHSFTSASAQNAVLDHVEASTAARASRLFSSK